MTEPQRDLLDAWLDSAQVVQPSAQLQRAVAEIPLRHPHAAAPVGLWPFGSLWKAASMAVVVCTLGVIAGASSVDLVSDDDAVIPTEYADLVFATSLDEEFTP